MITINQTALTDIERTQEGIQKVIAEIASTGGMEGLLTFGIAQLHHFVANNIQVLEARTKNSIFEHVSSQSNSVSAMLSTNVIYSPFVGHIPEKHSQQFFEYAAETEGPRVISMLGLEVNVRVNRAFS